MSWRPVRALISDDLPTLERPAKATSGRSGGGSCSSLAQPSRKRQSRANSTRAASSSSSLQSASLIPCHPGEEGGHVPGTGVPRTLARKVSIGFSVPCRCMITYCWMMVRQVDHTQ